LVVIYRKGICCIGGTLYRQFTKEPFAVHSEKDQTPTTLIMVIRQVLGAGT